MSKATTILELRRNRQPVEKVLADLRSDNMAQSLAAGQNLIQHAKTLKLNMRDYLCLAVDPEQGMTKGAGLDGYEAALAYLDLPVKDDYGKGILLQAAAETFNTYPGTRALFPEVIDDVVQWKYRQTDIESVAPMLAQSRTVNGIEMITTVVDDKAEDYQGVGIIVEGSRIPIRSLRTSEKSVKFYKFGGGIETTYEFERRASLDVLTPYASRQQREVSIGQTAIATSLLINGDGVNGAAPVVTASSFNIPGVTVAAGRMQWEVFLKWLITRAQAGAPIDTVVGNFDMYFEWARMFAAPTIAEGQTQVDVLAKAGVQTAIENPRFNFNVKFAVSSTAPASKLVGFIRGETLEELVENGSDIEESIRSIENQKVRYVRTKNAGYRLVFGDTRSILELV